MKKPQHGIATERWSMPHYIEVRNWLVDNFGPGGTGGPNCGQRWGEQYDYGLQNFYMDEDVYILYLLRWV